MASRSVVPRQDNQLTPASGFKLDRPTVQLMRLGQHEVIKEDIHREISGARIYNTAQLGDGLMTCLDHLRQHEARSAAEDPLVADEYALIRRAVLYAGLEEINRYARRR